MKIFHNHAAAAGFCLAVLYSGQSAATVITIGCAYVGNSCTLAELQAGGSVNINDVLFNQFYFTTPSFGSLGAAQIRVGFIDSGVGANVGLVFSPINPFDSPWFASSNGGGSARFDSNFGYQVGALSGYNIGAASLSVQFIENVSGGYYDYLYADEYIDRFPYASVSLRASCQEAILPYGACDGQVVRKEIAFGPNPDPLYIETSMGGSATRVTGGGGLEIGISRVTQVFTRVIPEPTTLALVGLGLAGLASSRRRKP